MRFQCSNCLSIVAIDDNEAGQAVACGQCNTILVVPSARTAPGAVIDDFVIEKEIGKGGLATVYLAHQISLDRSVALKILHTQFSADTDFIDSFIREARAAAQLNHPNIVQAYAVGEDEGIHFFAMEYVQGTTLKNVLAHSGRLVIDRALMITTEIAKALDFAWTNKNLVHRDIKPDNIIVTETGKVKLADLGLARIRSDIMQEGGTGEILGTPQYIAPELLLGHLADNRTDIYSLGATLYHAATGQYPYNGNSAAEIARRHISDPLPPPKELVPDMPEPVDKLIEIMMAKRPGQRFQSSAELLNELERVKAGKMPQHPIVSGLQTPIDLAHIEEELALVIPPAATPDSAEEVDDQAAGAQPGGTAKTSSGKTKLKFGKSKKTLSFSRKGAGRTMPAATDTEEPETTPAPDAATETAPNSPPAPTPHEAAAMAAAIPGMPPPEPGTQTTPDNQPEGEQPAPSSATQRAAARARAQARRKRTTKLLFAAMGAIAVMAVIAIVAVMVIGQRNRRLAVYKDLMDLGLTEQQAIEIRDLQRLVRQQQPQAIVLDKAQNLLRQYAEIEVMPTILRQSILPYLENQARGLRESKHQEEIAQWRSRAAELREQKRQADAEQTRRERERLIAQQREIEQQRARERAQEYIAELEREQRKLRRETLELCQQNEYAEAKLKLTAMTMARNDQFAQWGKTKQNIIDLAERAYNLVRNSEDLLKGVKMAVKGSPRPAEIVSIDIRNITAEVREMKYERGVPVGENVQRHTIPLHELPTAQLMRYMETAWNRKGGDAEEFQVMTGAYLLARNENLLLSERLLKAANRPDQTDPMLRELDAMKQMQD